MARGNNVLEIIINGTNRAGPAFKQAATQAVRMGAAVTTALVGATIAAGKFETGLAEISTLLDGDVTTSIKQIRGELLDLSTEFGQSIGKMTKARYDVISAGFTDAAESATVLRSASKLAVAGVSDVATAADLLTSALGGLQLGADQSERIINVLFQTVRKGKTTLTEMGQGLGKIFSTAKLADVSLEALGAAMATATAKGVKTAEAITGLNALMLALAAPTEEAEQALLDAGISMDEGFLQALIAVNKAAGESPAKLRELIPSIEALRVAAAIAGDIGLMTANLEEMNTSAGVVDEGVAKMADTFDYQLNRAKRSIHALVIAIGESLLPEAKEMLEGFNLLIAGLRDGDEEIKALTTTVGKWALGITAAGAALSILSTTMSALGPIIAGMGAAFATASGPMRLVMVSIFAIVAALIKYRGEIQEKLYPMAEKFNKEQGKTPGILGKIWQGIKKVDVASAGLLKLQSAFEARKAAGAAEAMGWADAAKSLREYADKVEQTGQELWDRAQKGPKEIDDAFVEGFDKAGDTVENAMKDILDTVVGYTADIEAEIRAVITGMVQAQKDAAELARIGAIPLGYIPPEPFRGRGGEEEGAGPVTEETATATEERIERIREQLVDLAKFTAEDFAQMAFSVGDAFANVATQIAAHMFGLTKGPLMLGRAFRQMAIGILADLARIIARLLVARALLSIFNLGSGGGIFGTALRQMAGLSTGGQVKTAAAGYSVPGSGGQFFAPIILPGSPGLDRTPVLATGGEMLIPRQRVNAMEGMLKKPMSAPRRNRGGDGSRRGMKVQLDLQANRPFNRQEQVQLTDSVTEGFDRSARYGS